MARRKAWAELTPAYRARLERNGITPTTHGTANLRRARGHDISLPHNKPERDRRKQHARERIVKAIRELQVENRKVGYLKDSDLLGAVGEIGIEGARILLEWQTYRTESGVAGSGHGNPANAKDRSGQTLQTFKEFVDANYPGLWDTVYEDWWSYAQETEGMNYY